MVDETGFVYDPKTNPMEKDSTLGRVGAVWGVLGVTLLLSTAIYRLAPLAIASFSEQLDVVHYASYALSIFFLGYSEGYKAFQKQFSPRIAARARYLAAHPTVLRVLLAPPFCMGMFHATRKRLILSWSVALGVMVLVVLVGRLAQPWRGIVDLGVVVALAWGMIAMWVYAARAVMGRDLPVSADVPAAAPPDGLPEAA